ncbi:hypothetical protein ACFL5V_08340 [Fibrobacterota bacterium]
MKLRVEMLEFENSFYQETYDEDFINKVCSFIFQWDSEDERDPVEVASLIFSVPEFIIQQWFINNAFRWINRVRPLVEEAKQTLERARNGHGVEYSRLEYLDKSLHELRRPKWSEEQRA